MQIPRKKSIGVDSLFYVTEFSGRNWSQQVNLWGVLASLAHLPMTDTQQTLLLLNKSLIYSGQKMFVAELVLEKEWIDLLVFLCWARNNYCHTYFLWIMFKSYRYSLILSLYYGELIGTRVRFTDSHLF